MDELTLNISGTRQILKEIGNNDLNNTNSPGASSGKVQTPTSAGSEASNNNILKLANTPSSINGKIQSPSKSETPNSSKKLSSHSKKPHDNFRNAFLLDDDNSFQEELPDIVKVNPIPHHVLAAQSVPDSPTTQALKALEKLSVNSPPVLANNPTSSTEHSDDEFTECQSYSALNASSAQGWQSVHITEQLPPDSTTKSANTTQEITESEEKSLNKSFPVLKTPKKTTFPVSPTPDEDIKDYKALSEDKKVEIEGKQLEVPLNPPEILIQTPSNFEKKSNLKRISFPSTPEVREEEGNSQFPRALTPDETERQSIATLNGTFAASSEALNSTINLQQDKNETFEGEDEKTAVVNTTASFMSANATMPIHKMDSGFASTNMEENQNVTCASFESANQTMNMEVNTTTPMNGTSPMNTTIPVVEDDCLNVTTSGDAMPNATASLEHDNLNVTTSGINEMDNTTTCLEKGREEKDSEDNITTSLEKGLEDREEKDSEVNITTSLEKGLEDREEKDSEVNITTSLEKGLGNSAEKDSEVNITTSLEKGLEDREENKSEMNTKTSLEKGLENREEKDPEMNTTTCLEKGLEDREEKVPEMNITTNLEKENQEPKEQVQVNLHETMSMDVDMDDDVEVIEMHNSPIVIEDVDMGEPETFQKFDSQVDFLSDKEKQNTANEKEKEVESLVNLQGMNDFQGSNDFGKACQNEVPDDDEFTGTPGVIFDPSAFDFLEGKGQQEQEVDIRRTSLLLRFDPLCQQLQADKPKAALILKDLKEEENEVSSPLLLKLNQTIPGSPGIQITTKSVKKNEKMSVGVIQEMPMENNDIKSYENLSSQINEKQMKMDDEPENKAKNEVSRNDEVEKKLKDSEQREEALLKRITEKDKTIAKMTGVIEAYEKAIAELIAEKEQLSQNFEKELSDVKADRDTNYYHLTSLETTFSDLNIKYEKNKELLSQVKASEEKLLAERKVNGENLKLQEQRYEKMKTHAMMQLEIANQKIEDYRKQHTIETTRLKALLKKEEITRAAVSDQLQQKAKENDQLMKICDELINSQQPS
ncbi:TACC1 family protein [Megaselia abdita]